MNRSLSQILSFFQHDPKPFQSRKDEPRTFTGRDDGGVQGGRLIPPLNVSTSSAGLTENAKDCRHAAFLCITQSSFHLALLHQALIKSHRLFPEHRQEREPLI